MDDQLEKSFFKGQIDLTDFGTVRRYVKTPGTRIDGAFVVESSTLLEEVAYIAWSGDVSRWKQLLKTGRVEVASADTPDDARCRVIFLPPVYFIQFPAPESSL